jgi:hypothetical protein
LFKAAKGAKDIGENLPQKRLNRFCHLTGTGSSILITFFSSEESTETVLNQNSTEDIQGINFEEEIYPGFI